jgi:phage recombination protein Bet
MYVLRGPAAQPDVGWTYACHAHKCTYTHTQKEKATMTATHETATAALAIRDGQTNWNPDQLAMLRQIGAEEAPEGDLKVFFHYCQATQLDPFTKQIRLRKDRQKVRKPDAEGRMVEQWVNRWSIETEIDGYRVIAQRAAKREGVKLSYGPTVWYDAAGGTHEVWLGEEPPAGAKVTVYKDGAPFPAVIRLKSFAKYTQGGQLQAMWAVMPDHLLAKCAEAQALRKAFPHDLGDIRTSDEAAPAAPLSEPPAASVPDGNGEQRAIAPARQKPPQRQQKPVAEHQQATGHGKVTEALMAAIGQRFDSMDITDPDECDGFLHQLANKPNDDELTDHDLRGALGDLAKLDDREALVKWCSPEPEAS